MKNLKTYKNFLNEAVDRVRNISELRKMEEWIEDFWNKINDLPQEEIGEIFIEIEDKYGNDVVTIIDGIFSADKLHYYQTGSTVITGGIDTGDFIEDFQEISSGIDKIVDEHL